MTLRMQTTAMVAALYVSDYGPADLAQLRDRAATDVDAVITELTPLVLTVTAAATDDTVRAGRLDPTRLAECEHVANTVLGALALAELRALLGLPGG